MAVNDLFDNNAYAHDPRNDFMNWAVWEGGAYDYAADQKGYTDGAAIDLNQKRLGIPSRLFPRAEVLQLS